MPLFFLGCTAWLGGSSFPDWGLNLAPAVKAPSPNHWTIMAFLKQMLNALWAPHSPEMVLLWGFRVQMAEHPSSPTFMRLQAAVHNSCRQCCWSKWLGNFLQLKKCRIQASCLPKNAASWLMLWKKHCKADSTAELCTRFSLHTFLLATRLYAQEASWFTATSACSLKEISLGKILDVSPPRTTGPWIINSILYSFTVQGFRAGTWDQTTLFPIR